MSLNSENTALFEDAIKDIKPTVIKKLMEKYKVSRKSFYVSMRRGTFSKSLSYKMAEITAISPLFWQNPSMFKFNGERR